MPISGIMLSINKETTCNNTDEFQMRYVESKEQDSKDHIISFT